MNDSYYSNFRKDMLPFLPSSSPNRILEIGCGRGNFRTNFGDVEYWGVEPVEAIAQKAKELLTRVLVGTYDEIEQQLPSHYFDLIVCNDVIEHMRDPREFLSSVKSKLAAGGHMVVSLPNIRNAETLYSLIFLGRFDYTEAGILDYTHLHLFTMKSFCSMAIDAGWKIMRCAPLQMQPFTPLKRIIIKAISLLIPEFGTAQFGALLKLN